MSLVRRMFPFARCASTVAGQSAAAAASTSTTAQPAQPEAVPDIGELRTRARRVYKDVSLLAPCFVPLSFG